MVAIESRIHCIVACLSLMGAALLTAAPVVDVDGGAGTLTRTTLLNFDGTSGAFPYADLVQGLDGGFYGTTHSGGVGNLGTIFKVTAAGVKTNLVEFTGFSGANLGGNPTGNLVQGSDGNFYGMTSNGGSVNTGTVFKMTPAGVLTSLVSFTGGGGANPGSFPAGGLVDGGDGSFYGMTYQGGTGDLGTIFKITAAGARTTLVNFTGTGGANPGSSPRSGLTRGGDGNFYGTTIAGGASNFGTIFKMTPAGTLTNLASLTGTGGAAPGSYPHGGLVRGKDGDFYGMTGLGGTADWGTIFKITAAGVRTILVNFTGESGANIGGNAYGSLLQGSDGTFYGTTQWGGASGLGTVFKMTPAGVMTNVLEFTGTSGANPGSYPRGSLTRGNDGTLYGTTLQGGSGAGTIFKLTAPLAVASAAEGANGTKTGTFSDAQGNATVTLTASTGTITQNNAAGTWSWSGPALEGPATQAVTITATGSSTPAGTAAFNFNVTNAAPTVAITGPATAEKGVPVGFTFMATDPSAVDQAAGFRWVVNYGDGSGSLTFTPAVPSPLVYGYTFASYGTFIVTVTVTDKDSGVSTQASKSITIQDTTPPVLAARANLGPFEATSAGGATVTYAASTATDNSGVAPTITYSKNSGTLFPIGVTTVTVTARDGANNTSTGNFTVTVVDTTAPNTTITSSTPVTNSATATITFTGTDLVGVTGYEGRLDGAAYAPVTSPVSLAGLTNGPHTYSVRAKDAAGNVDASPAVVSWTVLLEAAPIVAVNGDGGPLALSSLVSFTYIDGPNPGGNPRGSLVQASDGNFYGMTLNGGAAGNGTIFKMTPAGVQTNLVSFTGNSGANPGSNPNGSLVQGSDGNFYGMTSQGGTGGNGVIFKMTPAGVQSTLVNFTGTSGANPGKGPWGGLVQGSDGDFYGMTVYGGTNDFGTIFKMTSTGARTTLVNFTGDTGANPGQYPFGSLLQASDGNFYGMTFYGGATGQGTLFRMTPAGVRTTLVNFTGTGGANPGSFPRGNLVQASDGTFYGMTQQGGASGLGTIFKMTTAGVHTTLVEFTGVGGANPGKFGIPSLVQGGDGSFYGMTQQGGAADSGTIFRMTPAGARTTLVDFNGTNGANPEGNLALGSDGKFYGMTYVGGAFGSGGPGTIFKLSVPVTVASSAIEGSSGAQSGTFSDVQGNATVSLTASTGTITRNTTNGTWSWTAPATDGPGTSSVTITATDTTSRTAATAFTFGVTNAIPSVAITAPASADANSTVNFTFTATDPSAADQAAGFAWSLNYGDGTGTQAVTAGTASPLTRSHTFANAGNYTVTATATDKDGGVSTVVSKSIGILQAINATSYVVNSLADTDDGVCSPLGTGTGNQDCTLREAINAANSDPGAETITFSVTGTINLTSVLPDLSTDISMVGPGAAQLSVRRNTGGNYRVFKVGVGANVALGGITVSNGSVAGASIVGAAGGGIFNGGMLTLQNCMVSANRAAGTNGYQGVGGGIYGIAGSQLVITASTISGNIADQGAGLFNHGGTLSIGSSTVSGNTSTYNGGGIYTRNDGGTSSSTTITNSTISTNSAANNVQGFGGGGGGIFNYTDNAASTLLLTHVTVANNSAADGGGVFNYAGATATIRSTIVANNTAPSTPNLMGTFNSTGYNLFRNTTGATVNETANAGTILTNVDPMLGLLSDNGGPTLTQALLDSSPALDKGNSFGSTTDQRGLIRPVDLNDSTYPNAPGGGGSDIGAFEKAAPIPPPVVAVHANVGPIEATGPGGAIVTYAPATATDGFGGSPTISYSKNSGALFAIGITTVTISATDQANQTSTGTFTVTVVDTTPPVVAAHANVGPIEATSAAGAVVTYAAGSATDAVTLSPTITYSQDSGTTFPVGTTTVTITARDAANNVGTRTFTVTVQVTPVAPILGSTTLASITSTGATLGGNVSADGGMPVTARGVVYSLTSANADPQIGGAGVTNMPAGGTTGAFTIPVSGLASSSGYSFRAYASNSVGTRYSSPVSTFSTAGSSNADLSGLAFNGGSISPAFSANTTAYTATVPNATTSITVTPNRAQQNSTVRVNAAVVASGNTSAAIPLGIGPNIITIAVTAQDGTTTRNYTLTITRNAPPVVAVNGVGEANSFSNTASLITARAQHTAALLPNGKVLVSCGREGYGNYGLSSSELFDPATNTWTGTGTLATARADHTMTLLGNGKVLVVGGSDSTYRTLASAELYDPATNLWTAAGNLNVGRSVHDAVLLANGKVLVAGGVDSSYTTLTSAEIYDPVTNTWTPAGSLANARFLHRMTLLPSGKVLLAGGGNLEVLIAGAECYDPATNTWSDAGSLTVSRQNHTLTTLNTGKVLTTGGTGPSGLSMELYDPVSNTWTTAPSPPGYYFSHTASLLHDGNVLITGSNYGGTMSGTILYHPTTNTWADAASLAAVRRIHTSTVLADGRVLVVGGESGEDSLSSAEIYGPTQVVVTTVENTAATQTGTFSDADGNSTVTLTASIGTITQNNIAGTWSWTAPAADGPATSTVTITATDTSADTATAAFSLNVTNVIPTVAITSLASVAEDVPVDFTFTATDSGGADQAAGFSWSLDFGDGQGVETVSAGTTSPLARTHLFANPGIFTVTATATDKDGETGTMTKTITVTAASAASRFADWAGAAGLSGANNAPFGDGVSNLLKYAFNMNAAGPDVSVLATGGSAGLPLIVLNTSGPQPRLTVTFLRRKGSGLIYTPQASETLGGFVAMTGTQTVTSINAEWERVSLESPVSASHAFARVQVSLP